MNRITEKNSARTLANVAVFAFPPLLVLLYEYVRLGRIGNMTADGQLYLSIADNFLKTGHFIQTARWFKGLVVPPVVPAVLTLLRFLHFSEEMIIAFQALLFGLSCLLLFDTECRLFGRCGLAPIVYTLAYLRCRLLLGNILVEHYYLFFLCLLIWILMKELPLSRKTVWMNLVGVMLFLSRPALIPVYLAILIWTIHYSCKEKHIVIGIFALFLPILCLSLNLAVNYRETGEIIPLESYSGTDLYVTACQNAPVTQNEGILFFDETRDRIFNDQEMTMSEKSAALNQLARSFIRHHPCEYLSKTFQRCYELFLKAYWFMTVIPIAGGLLLCQMKGMKTKRRLVHKVLLTLNLFLALMTSFGIPEVRYTAVIWPLAAVHTAAAGWFVFVRIRNLNTVT